MSRLPRVTLLVLTPVIGLLVQPCQANQIVEGIIWYDVGPNPGIREEGEAGVMHPQVLVFRKGDGRRVDYTWADRNGRYRFVLPPGEYVLRVVPMSHENLTFTIQNAGNDPNRDSDVDQETGTAEFTVYSGDGRIIIDAGMVPRDDEQFERPDRLGFFRPGFTPPPLVDRRDEPGDESVYGPYPLVAQLPRSIAGDVNRSVGIDSQQ